jgi:hypothetical protein
MADEDKVEKIIEIELTPNVAPTPTGFLAVPLGEVWRIFDIASLDQASPSFRLEFHQNGVRQVSFDANTVYERNNLRPMASSLADCRIYYGHRAYFVAIPYLPLTEPVHVRFRLRIRRTPDEMTVSRS